MNKHLIGSKFAQFIFDLSVISLRMTKTKTADIWEVSSNLEEKIKGSGDHGQICGSCLPALSATSSERDQRVSLPCFAYLKHYQ